MSKENPEVDVVNCDEQVERVDLDFKKVDPNDDTEYSSSFGGTCSGSEDELKNDSSDMEVDSNGPSMFFGDSNRIFRKKKTSEQWRNCIRPVEWRCKWLELRIKELDDQASIYDRELAVYNQEKQLQAALTSTDNCAARGVSLTHRSHIKAMTRRKRKKYEETCNIPLYMAQHPIFSYYDKKPDRDEFFVDEGHANQAEKEDSLEPIFEWPMPGMGEDEKHLEQILFDIDSLSSRVLNLVTELNSINTAGEIFSTSGMSLPGCDEQRYHHSLSPRCSPVSNVGRVPFKQLNNIHNNNTSPYASEFENEEIIPPGSAVSSFGDASHPDVIESSTAVDLLSSAITCAQRQIGNLSNGDIDDILINNQAVDAVLHSFEMISNHTSEIPQANPMKEEEEEDGDENSEHQTSSSETETDAEIASISDRSAPNQNHVSAGAGSDVRLRRSNRKRKARKASPGSWIGERKRSRKNSKKRDNSSS
ncbi:hypothetical protein ZOSMA_72G00410 [Zostera marina]|uniref:Uncharacterized protein n=1 Tax=Zostera marina TaxID=29655 RepID=A0A0K9NQ13_ZOSMR|nr:hypothetical protein ZOSMA_72G00410 [Zostera marina]